MAHFAGTLHSGSIGVGAAFPLAAVPFPNSSIPEGACIVPFLVPSLGLRWFELTTRLEVVDDVQQLGEAGGTGPDLKKVVTFEDGEPFWNENSALP